MCVEPSPAVSCGRCLHFVFRKQTDHKADRNGGNSFPHFRIAKQIDRTYTQEKRITEPNHSRQSLLSRRITVRVILRDESPRTSEEPYRCTYEYEYVRLWRGASLASNISFRGTLARSPRSRIPIPSDRNQMSSRHLRKKPDACRGR